MKIADLVQELNSNVLSVHMSDNGIRSNDQLMLDLIDAFDIEDESLETKAYVAGLSKLTKQGIDEEKSQKLKRIAK